MYLISIFFYTINNNSFSNIEIFKTSEVINEKNGLLNFCYKENNDEKLQNVYINTSFEIPIEENNNEVVQNVFNNTFEIVSKEPSDVEPPEVSVKKRKSRKKLEDSS